MSVEEAHLIELQVYAFLRPRAAELFAHLESATDRPVPNDLIISLRSLPSGGPAQPDWHNFMPTGNQRGKRTLESTLVQTTQQMLLGDEDFRFWHRVACQAIYEIVDPTHICVLEILW
jgi:hypothetical protein